MKQLDREKIFNLIEKDDALNFYKQMLKLQKNASFVSIHELIEQCVQHCIDSQAGGCIEQLLNNEYPINIEAIDFTKIPMPKSADDLSKVGGYISIIRPIIVRLNIDLNEVAQKMKPDIRNNFVLRSAVMPELLSFYLEMGMSPYISIGMKKEAESNSTSPLPQIFEQLMLIQPAMFEKSNEILKNFIKAKEEKEQLEKNIPIISENISKRGDGEQSALTAHKI